MKSSMHSFLVFALSILGMANLALAPAFAQTEDIPRRSEAYAWHSGTFDGDPAAKSIGATLEAYDLVTVPGASWLQLRFDSLRLGDGSYVQITSHADGAVQRLDADAARAWNYRSAYFNGDTLDVELFVAPYDRGVFVEIDEITVGEPAPADKSICGATDDRVFSNDARVGRIMPLGCTGWLADTGRLITAGHCLNDPDADVFQLNVPNSNTNGTVNHPGLADQYPLDTGSFVFVDGGIGNDWGVFDARINTTTGLTTHEAQGASFDLVQDLGPANLRITGFGLDGGIANQSQQTHAGPNQGSTGTTMRYRADTRGGNSGSPVIDVATGRAVGVHTHGGCTVGGGSNSGTSFFRNAFWTEANDPQCTTGAPTPGFISGPNHDLCQGASETYFTSSNGATAFEWEVLGTGFRRITHNPNITLNGHIFAPGFYTIRVRARNFCGGWSGWRNANLIVLSNSQCSGCSGRFCR